MRLILTALLAFPSIQPAAPGAAPRSAPEAPAPAAAPALLDAPPAATMAAHADTTFLDDVELGARLVGRGLTAPGRWTATQWLAIPAAVAVLAVVSTADDDIAELAETHQGSVGDAWFGTLEPFGQEYSIPLVVGIYAGGWALDRPAWRRTAVEAAAASVVAGGIVTPVLKLLVGRARPRRDVGSYAFDPFSGDLSFPSGHTTQAFAIASVIAAESEAPIVDILAYGIATSVAGARIYHDAHFLTDVLAGAAIGTVVGRGMVRGGRELAGDAEPVLGRSGGGVTVGLRFRLP